MVRKSRTKRKRRGRTLPIHPLSGGMRYYTAPVAYMKGRGLGGTLVRLFRNVVPFLRRPMVQKGLKRIGQSAARAGIEAVSSALSSEKPLTQTLRDSTKRQTQILLKEGKRALAPPKSINRKVGKGKVSFPVRRDVFSS